MSSYWLLMVFDDNFRRQWEERSLGTRSCDNQQPFLEELGDRECGHQQAEAGASPSLLTEEREGGLAGRGWRIQSWLAGHGVPVLYPFFAVKGRALQTRQGEVCSVEDYDVREGVKLLPLSRSDSQWRSILCTEEHHMSSSHTVLCA